jgi:hypothetical protein
MCLRCRGKAREWNETKRTKLRERLAGEFEITVEEPAQAHAPEPAPEPDLVDEERARLAESARSAAKGFTTGDQVVVPVAQSGQSEIVGVASDFHFGSKYCLRAQLRDFVVMAYSRGAREILCSGDWLDGCYPHGRFELSHHGIDEQADDAIQTLPIMPGLSYWGITGNHDHTFAANVGLSVGAYLEDRFRRAGRQDVHFCGDAGAFVRLRGATFHLWHPIGKPPYALSYLLQKEINVYSPGNKPDFLLVGHLHKALMDCCVRGVHAFLVPCFQGQGSAFSMGLVGAPAIGGIILTWRQTDHGTLRSVASELISYYEDERPREIG